MKVGSLECIRGARFFPPRTCDDGRVGWNEELSLLGSHS